MLSGRRPVEADEDSRVARLFEMEFDCFRGVSGEGWGMREREKRMEDVLVDDSNVSTPRRTRKRLESEARQRELFAFGFMIVLVQPGLGDRNKIRFVRSLYIHYIELFKYAYNGLL